MKSIVTTFIFLLCGLLTLSSSYAEDPCGTGNYLVANGLCCPIGSVYNGKSCVLNGGCGSDKYLVAGAGVCCPIGSTFSGGACVIAPCQWPGSEAEYCACAARRAHARNPSCRNLWFSCTSGIAGTLPLISAFCNN